MKTTGERIKDIRLELGETLEEFGKRFNPPIHKGSVSLWENNRNFPNPKNLKVIAEIGGTTVEELHFSSLIGKRIKHIRVSRKETLEEFAENIIKASGNSVKTGKSNVSRWEKGLNKPNDITLQAIAELGGITVDQLLNSNPLSDYSTDELLQELDRRGIETKQLNNGWLSNHEKRRLDKYIEMVIRRI